MSFFLPYYFFYPDDRLHHLSVSGEVIADTSPLISTPQGFSTPPNSYNISNFGMAFAF
jgi:hypothetical protein